MSRDEFELLNLKDIFDAGKRQLRVPDYQRGYSWEFEQREDLIGDIKQIQSQKHRHFTGTVVASKQGNSNCFDLVDGQQRITSLVILISCLLRAAKQNRLSEIAQTSLEDVENIYLRSGVQKGNTAYQLQLGPIRDPLFHEVLLQGQPKIEQVKNKADQNIVDAAVQFDAWLKELKDDGLGDVFLAVTSKLGFLLYAPEQDAEIGIMFEVINNRGKPLSELEKIKNYLIYYAGRHQVIDLRNKVNECWPTLLQSLNTAQYTTNDDENRFLRVCWIVFHDYNKTKSYHVYDNLKLTCPPDKNDQWQKLVEFVDFVTSAAKTYASLFHPESSGLSDREQTFLQRIALHPANASVLPLVVALYSKEPDANRRADILDILERLNFRYYITGIANRNDTGQGELFGLAFDYYNDNLIPQENPSNLQDSEILRERLVRFVNTNANDHKFVKYLTLDKDEAGDYHKWPALKFFLGSYEDSLLEANRQGSRLPSFVATRDKVNSNDFFHLEHIWAAKDFTVVNDEIERDVNKRRLGNFILLTETLNIIASNARPEEKVVVYFNDTTLQPNTLMIRELLGDFNQAQKDLERSEEFKRKVAKYWYTLYQKFLDIREQKMLNFAIKRWGLEGLIRPVKEVIIERRIDSNEIYRCQPKYSDETNVIDVN